jgi:hypothetical protein
MPLLSRWFLRAALLYLVAGLLIMVVRVIPGLAGSARAVAIAPVGVHFLVVGWVTQMIVGVAWWMFPRPGRARTHGSGPLGWFAFAALNSGLLLRAVAEPAVSMGAAGWPRAALVCSAALQLMGAVTAAALLWPRLAERR